MGRVEIPQRSSPLCAIPFIRKHGRRRSETARVHHAARRRGGVAARSARAAARYTGDRRTQMIKKTLWTIFMIVSTCSAGTTADIRRVVTALDASDKAIALFDSRLTLDLGGIGTPSTILWTSDSVPAGLSFKDDSAAKSLPTLPPDAGT